VTAPVTTPVVEPVETRLDRRGLDKLDQRETDALRNDDDDIQEAP
jgi:hypothetical protein